MTQSFASLFVTSSKLRDVGKAGARGATAPPLGAIFALKYLKKKAKLGKNGQSTPPPEGESKIRTSPRGGRIYVPVGGLMSVDKQLSLKVVYFLQMY